MSWEYIYLTVWGAAFLASLLLTARFRRWGMRIGFLDHPHQEQHKRDRRAVPKLGGPAVFLSWLTLTTPGAITAPEMGNTDAHTPSPPKNIRITASPVRITGLGLVFILF